MKIIDFKINFNFKLVAYFLIYNNTISKSIKYRSIRRFKNNFLDFLYVVNNFLNINREEVFDVLKTLIDEFDLLIKNNCLDILFLIN